MDVNLKVETINLNLALKEMQRRLSGRVAPARIMEYVTGKVLESAIAKTSKATRASIQATANKTRFRTYDLGQGKKRYFLDNRYSGAIWGQIQAKMAASLARRIAEIGLSKRLILIAAEKLGIKVAAPGYVLNAVPAHPGDASVSKQTTETSCIIKITLDSPRVAKHSSIPRALFAAIVGQRKNIQQSAARGTFNELSAVAKQFPGLIVKDIG